MSLSKLWVLILAAIPLAAVAGCGDEVFLVSLTVAPDAPTVEQGSTRQFTVTGTLNNGDSVSTVANVHWEAADVTTVPSPLPVASIDETSGLATCLNVGPSTIIATAPVAPGAVATVTDRTTLNCVATVP